MGVNKKVDKKLVLPKIISLKHHLIGKSKRSILKRLIFVQTNLKSEVYILIENKNCGKFINIYTSTFSRFDPSAEA